MSEQDKPLTVDLAPTWPEAMEILIAVLEDGTEIGKREARAELRRLAAGQVDAQVFAFLRGLRFYFDFEGVTLDEGDALAEVFEMTKEEAAAAVERFKDEAASRCTRCGAVCDFGQRGDGPAEESAVTGKPYCGRECLTHPYEPLKEETR